MATKRKVRIRLMIKDQAQDPGNNYVQAKDSNGADVPGYWYKFKDGDDGNGTVLAMVDRCAIEIRISLRGRNQRDYDIKDVKFFKDDGTINHNKTNQPLQASDGGDVGLAYIDDDENSAVIWDLAAFNNRYYHYSVVIEPVAGSPQFYCDPMIINDWAGGNRNG